MLSPGPKSRRWFIADSLLGPYPCFPIRASNFDDHFGCLQCSLSQITPCAPPPPIFIPTQNNLELARISDQRTKFSMYIHGRGRFDPAWCTPLHPPPHFIIINRPPNHFVSNQYITVPDGGAFSPFLSLWVPSTGPLHPISLRPHHFGSLPPTSIFLHPSSSTDGPSYDNVAWSLFSNVTIFAKCFS